MGFCFMVNTDKLTEGYTYLPTNRYIRQTDKQTDNKICLMYCLSEMCETYSALPEEDKFEILCAPNFGKY